MKRSDPQVRDCLGPVLQAIERIERCTRDLDQGAFVASDLTQDAVIRNLMRVPAGAPGRSSPR